MATRNGLSTPVQVILGVIGLLAVVGLIGGGIMFFTQGSIAGGDQPQQPTPDKDQVDANAPWDGRSVKLNIRLRNLSSASLKSGTLHLYREKPAEWGDPQTISNTYGTQAEYTTYSVESDGTTTIQETPGKYYIAVENSGDYTKFLTVTIPDGDGQFKSTKLVDYNKNPKLLTFTVADRYTLGAKSFDLGISKNSTSQETYEVRKTYQPSDQTEYHLEKIIVQTGDNSGGVDPTTDSDSDGVYDEGISKAWVEVSGSVSGDGERVVFFQPNNGIDKLGANNKVQLRMGGEDGLVFDSDHSMDVNFGITATEVQDGGSKADGDEEASDGERFFDINYCDVAGNCNSVKGVTG